MKTTNILQTTVFKMTAITKSLVDKPEEFSAISIKTFQLQNWIFYLVLAAVGVEIIFLLDSV